MKMKTLTTLLAVILISTSCHGKKEKYIYTDTTFNHIDFTEITFTVDKKTKDTLRIEGLLKQTAIIDGITCYDNVSLAKGWKPEKFTLASKHTFGGYTFPRDAYIEINVKRIRLEDHFFEIAGAAKVNRCKFSSDPFIDSLSCEITERVVFTTDWKLRACILGEDDTIAGNVFKKGSLVMFGKHGSINIYCLYNPIIQGYSCSRTDYTHYFWFGHGEIRLYSSGQLEYFKPIEDIEIQGVFCKCSSRGRIHLYESGKLWKCISAKDQTIDGVFYKKKLKLEFDEEGNVTKSYKDKL